MMRCVETNHIHLFLWELHLVERHSFLEHILGHGWRMHTLTHRSDCQCRHVALVREAYSSQTAPNGRLRPLCERTACGKEQMP